MNDSTTDKYFEYFIDFKYKLDEETEDKLINEFCETHPSAPQCKIFDD